MHQKKGKRGVEWKEIKGWMLKVYLGADFLFSLLFFADVFLQPGSGRFLPGSGLLAWAARWCPLRNRWRRGSARDSSAVAPLRKTEQNRVEDGNQKIHKKKSALTCCSMFCRFSIVADFGISSYRPGRFATCSDNEGFHRTMVFAAIGRARKISVASSLPMEKWDLRMESSLEPPFWFIRIISIQQIDSI